jgi:hypothetical protein
MCYKLKTYTAYIVTMDVFLHTTIGHEVSDFQCQEQSLADGQMYHQVLVAPGCPDGISEPHGD